MSDNDGQVTESMSAGIDDNVGPTSARTNAGEPASDPTAALAVPTQQEGHTGAGNVLNGQTDEAAPLETGMSGRATVFGDGGNLGLNRNERGNMTENGATAPAQSYSVEKTLRERDRRLIKWFPKLKDDDWDDRYVCGW